MTDSDNAKSLRDSTFIRGWRKVPLAVRAVILGFFVSTIGVGAWVLSLTAIPAPWSIAAMAVLLWLYWKYFSGSWWPESTKEARRACFRATRLPSSVWKWSLAAAALLVVIFQSSLVVTFRFVEFPAELFKEEYRAIAEAPLWIAWLFIVMASLVAGICEETGFRGYMQAPLEKRYGPVIAITIVTVVFLAAHLHQAWLGPIMFQLVAASVLIGVLAYASGSLIPGMIGHIVLDIFNFSYWWSDVAGKFDRRPIAETGWDAHALGWIVILVTALAAYLWIIRRLIAIRGNGTRYGRA